MTPEVSVRISGGLGNQMFQYAAARALSQRLAVPLTLDLSFYDRARHRGYGLQALPLAPHGTRGRTGGGRLARLGSQLLAAGQLVLGQAAPVYREPHFHFDPGFEQLQAPVHLLGHFQSPRYFAPVASQLVHEMMPAAASDTFSQQIAAAMVRAPSAALHVRRGDYLSNPKNRALFASCPVAYYASALQRLPADCTVYVFSDDMAWARAELPRSRPLVFVEDGQPRSGLADLWLMAQAGHHIIANSSLSWWGAWLAQRPAGHTVAPRHWFVNPAFDDRDLLPVGWARL